MHHIYMLLKQQLHVIKWFPQRRRVIRSSITQIAPAYGVSADPLPGVVRPSLRDALAGGDCLSTHKHAYSLYLISDELHVRDLWSCAGVPMSMDSRAGVPRRPLIINDTVARTGIDETKNTSGACARSGRPSR
jgi:hypothetical protein